MRRGPTGLTYATQSTTARRMPRSLVLVVLCFYAGHEVGRMEANVTKAKSLESIGGIIHEQ